MRPVKISVDDEVLLLRGVSGSVSNAVVGSAYTFVFATGLSDDLSKLSGNSYKVEDFGFKVTGFSTTVPITYAEPAVISVSGSAPFSNATSNISTSIVYKGAILNPSSAGVMSGTAYYTHEPIVVGGSVTLAGYFWVLLRRLD
jgi:hypothetical protein